ncbi:hypothetical protein IPdc08_01410 [archaeon]|nr:hypothetical protein IPdc08_01410 [archaeon]
MVRSHPTTKDSGLSRSRYRKCMEERIVEFLTDRGICLGKDIYSALGEDSFLIWRTCKRSRRIIMKSIAKRYLRLDRKVPGLARLSPAPQREFLTYTVLGLNKAEVEMRAYELREEIKRISRYKIKLAKKISEKALEESDDAVREKSVFIIGGDVPLIMAHSDPRPERSLGKMVAGSDLDIVVIHENDLDTKAIKKLESVLLDLKYSLLSQPMKKEELDFLIKSMKDVKKQLEFTNFEDKVACKILNEAEVLAGNKEIYVKIRRMIDDYRVKEKIEELEEKGMKYRKITEEILLETENPDRELLLKTFTTTMEFSEIF